MIYITGDTHGKFDRIEYFCDRQKTTKDDLMIILGDAGVNYYQNRHDQKLKKYLCDLPITFMLIRGNHEARPDPEWPKHVVAPEMDKGSVYGLFTIEDGFPSILYALDGRPYALRVLDEWKTAYVIGGAYSVDKQYRLDSYAAGNHAMKWFPDEQLSPEEMDHIRDNFRSWLNLEGRVDYMLTHTCPLSLEPTDMFLPFIDQSTVDQSTEKFLDEIKTMMEEKHVTYEKWFCGHWHTDRTAPENLRFLFNDIISL